MSADRDHITEYALFYGMQNC